MRRLTFPLILGTSLAFAATSAFACENCAAPKAGITVGATLSTTEIDPTTVAKYDATGFGGLVRYTMPLTDRIGVYGQFDYMMLDGKTPSGNTESESGQTFLVGLHMQAADQISVRVSAGRAFVNSKHITLGDIEADGTAIGLAAGYHFNENSAVVAEYRTFNLDDRFGNADATSFGVSYEYRF